MTDERTDLIIMKLTKIETVLLGVEGTEDGGLVGDVRCIRKNSAELAIQVGDHGEAIARIITRCEERTECAPITAREARRLRFTTSDLKKQWKIGSVIGGMSGLIYIIVEFAKSI